jgi:hypothetical protein
VAPSNSPGVADRVVPYNSRAVVDRVEVTLEQSKDSSSSKVVVCSSSSNVAVAVTETEDQFKVQQETKEVPEIERK